MLYTVYICYSIYDISSHVFIDFDYMFAQQNFYEQETFERGVTKNCVVKTEIRKTYVALEDRLPYIDTTIQQLKSHYVSLNYIL